MMTEKRVRWGIVGAGKIAHRFARSLAHERRSELVAISCRSTERARAFADEHGVPGAGTLSDEALGGVAGAAHAALLARADVDAIYLSLPHGMHREWAVAALRAGKAVLCEKPACASAAEAREVVSVAHETGALFMEAMKTRFTPLYRRVRQLVAEGAIGELLRVEALLENDMGGPHRPGRGLHVGPRRRGASSWTRASTAPPGSTTTSPARSRSPPRAHAGTTGSTASSTPSSRWARRPHGSPPRPTSPDPGPRGSWAPPARSWSRTCTARSEPLFSPAQESARRSTSPTPWTTSTTRSSTSRGLILAGRTESDVMPLAATLRCAEMLDAVRERILASL